MAKQLISRIQLRRDTAANWKTNNTTLSKGEIALSYDVDENGVALLNSYRVKIGDGTTKWNSLDYFAQRVLVGSGAPATSLGENGQFYVDTTNKYLYFKNNGAWIAIGGDISGELDKKLDKNNTASYSVYGVAGAGDQVMFSITGGHNQIVGVGGDGKIPVGLLPDVVLGNVLYGGNLNSAPTDADTWLATPSASLKTRLGLTSTVTSITIKNQEGGTSTTGYGWKALEGVYFIANVKGTFAGFSFEIGDWLISTGDSWQKVDNTDAIKTVGGVAPVDGNVVVEGVTGVSVTGENSKLSIGLKLANETQLTGGAMTIAESGAQVSAVRLDKDGKLGVVIPKGVEYTQGTNIEITDNIISTVDYPKFANVDVNSTIFLGSGTDQGQLNKLYLSLESSSGSATYKATGVVWSAGMNGGNIALPHKTGNQTFALLSDLTGKQDKLTPTGNITISDTGVIDTVTGPTFSNLKVASQASFGDSSSGVTISRDTITAKNGVNKIEYDATGVTWIYNQDTGRINLPRKAGPQVPRTQTFALLSDLTGKQDSLTQGRNIEITGTTIQTTKELDATKIYNSSGGLVVGSGSSTVQIQASGVSLTAISSVNISANKATINAPTETPEGLTVGNGMSVTGNVSMADNLTVSGTIKTLPNNPAEQSLHEVVVDTDYVIIDGGTSTTTW